jgi:hypothetical protein
MKAYVGVEVWRQLFLTLALDVSRRGRFTSGESALGAHWVRGCFYTRAGMDVVEKRGLLSLLGTEPGFHRYNHYTNCAILNPLS